MSRNQLIPEMYRFQPERPLWALMISSLAATNATECLGKDKEWLFTSYDFPAQHWSHLRTTNRTESSFAHCSASHSANRPPHKLALDAAVSACGLGGLSLNQVGKQIPSYSPAVLATAEEVVILNKKMLFPASKFDTRVNIL